MRSGPARRRFVRSVSRRLSRRRARDRVPEDVDELTLLVDSYVGWKEEKDVLYQLRCAKFHGRPVNLEVGEDAAIRGRRVDDAYIFSVIDEEGCELHSVSYDMNAAAARRM